MRLGVAGLLIASIAALAGAQAAEPSAWMNKVDPYVLARTETTGQAEILIILEEQAEPAVLDRATSKSARGHAVYELLRGVAARTQAPLIDWLEDRSIPYRSFWIANMIWARADLDTIALLASRTDVRRLDANPRIRVLDPQPEAASDPGRAPIAIEWGLSMVNADDVWAMGFDGSGVVIAGQDTGYDWNHPALIESYRGWSGSTADHNYNWHDSIHSGGGNCGFDATEPCDDSQHGTHTMGTMVGDDGGANRTGMAPGAEWIACRNMDQGDGTPATYSECFQFFVAPTDLAGQNPDPTRAPDVINNSWHCPTSEGCSADTLKTVVANTRAAGIVVVASAGNSGSGCSSVTSPPAIYEETFSIGATDSSDDIASFSSRGPVTIDGSNRLKPDVSAPGVSVRSTVPGGGYAWFNGTSMASPHVAGLVALLLDARPDLRGQVSVIESLIRLSATSRTDFQECGGMPGSETPNPIYGYGRIDALATITGDADGDGVDNLNDCLPVDGSTWTVPGPVSDLMLGKDAPGTALSWTAPLGAGADALLYDVMRSDQPQDFASPTCLVFGSLQTTLHDEDEAGTIVHYLVRAANACGSSLGAASGPTARAVGLCGSELPSGNISAPRKSPLRD